jgi:hypothetical protein
MASAAAATRWSLGPASTDASPRGDMTADASKTVEIKKAVISLKVFLRR